MLSEAEDISLPFYLHIFQILIYLIMPACVIIISYLIEDVNVSVIIGAIIPCGINFVF
jgi:hypothetical protein